MAFLRQMMPRELFDQLIDALAREGHAIHENDLDMPDAQAPQQMSYQEYIASKRIQMEVHNGHFVNANNVYTSAAYMLAAYEQKDALQFNAAKADQRAMELFGSKAFRVYLDSHPGSLVAAAQNSFMDITHEGIRRMEEQIKRRDEKLKAVSRNLRGAASGKSSRYHRMLNKMERFAASPTEPSEAEKKDLLSSLGEFILKDCAPNAAERNEDDFRDAMCAVKALVPQESFKKVVDQVNIGRQHKVSANDFDEPNPPEARENVVQRANAFDENALEAFLG